MKLIEFTAACVIALFACGCASWSFEPVRTSRFVDEANNYVTVDYGREEENRESVFQTSSGVVLPFKSKLKVRVEMPDGTRFVAYQRMSVAGVLYMTDDEEWEYFEKGVACIVAQLAPERDGYLKRFEGVLCAKVRNPMEDEKNRFKSPHKSSAPSGFGRTSSGPRDSSGPRTVE